MKAHALSFSAPSCFSQLVRSGGALAVWAALACAACSTGGSSGASISAAANGHAAASASSAATTDDTPWPDPATTRSGERVYFGAANADDDTLSNERTVVRRVFAAAAGSPFAVHVTRDAPPAGTPVPFTATLYVEAVPVTEGAPPWRAIATGSSPGPTGTSPDEGVRLSETPAARANYLVELRADDAVMLKTSLDCLAPSDGPGDDRCATARQPKEACGGIAAPSAAVSCDLGLYCRFAPTTCGRGDQPGACARVPEFCYEIWRPVCGCDAHTYGNECVAAGRGMSIAHDGACADAGT
jgi:hypothetical protein